ncbi:MAG: iron donor protein CyaY [Bdellovibrionota bacterium]
MDEIEFRSHLKATYDRIEKGFEDVDPDVAECLQSLGAMTITLGDGSRCILSAQPSVRQLWLALAAKGTAYHFDFESKSGTWIDDKTKKIELRTFLETYLKEATGIEFQLK